MTRKQRVGLENSVTRTALLDAAELLMQEEGYAAVTSRRVGAKAGVKPQLVHYYFRTMDDLFIALFQRRAERALELAAEALESDSPLRVLWRQSSDPSHVAMNLEFMALANHRKALRAEMGRFGERLRQIQQEALARHFTARGIEPQISPGVATLLMGGVGSVLVLEAAIGMSNAHAEAEALVEAVLRRLETDGVMPPITPGLAQS